jgi:hypothetical protein
MTALYRMLAAGFGMASIMCLNARTWFVRRAARANLAQLQRRAFADWSRSRSSMLNVVEEDAR